MWLKTLSSRKQDVRWIRKEAELSHFYASFFKDLTYMGLELLYSVVFISTVQESESTIHIHGSPSFQTFLPTQISALSRVSCPIE